MKKQLRFALLFWFVITFVVAAQLIGVYLRNGMDGINLFIQEWPLSNLPITLASTSLTWILFGVWLFARPFFWEDVVSFLVLALHTAYLWAWFGGHLATRELMLLALAAYASYVVNATQFVLKLRAARLQQARDAQGAAALGTA